MQCVFLLILAIFVTNVTPGDVLALFTNDYSEQTESKDASTSEPPQFLGFSAGSPRPPGGRRMKVSSKPGKAVNMSYSRHHEDLLNPHGDLFDQDGNLIGDWSYCKNKTLRRIVNAAIRATPNDQTQIAEDVIQSIGMEFKGVWVVHAISKGYSYAPAAAWLSSDDCCIFSTKYNMMVQAWRFLHV